MSNFKDHADMFDGLFDEFIESKFDDANAKFEKYHDYHCNHLKFRYIEFDDNEIVLHYKEETSHDEPYSIELRFPKSDLIITQRSSIIKSVDFLRVNIQDRTDDDYVDMEYDKCTDELSVLSKLCEVKDGDN